MDQRLILITLLIKLGVMAAVASAVMRSRYFKALLFNEQRTLTQKVHLTLFICIPLSLGVWIRLSVRNFFAADVGLECAILMGALGGRFTGALGGAMVGLPALLHGEFLAMPFDVLAGLLSGVLRTLAQHEDIWSFSPFVDLSVYRWIRRNISRPRLDWQTSFFLFILGLQFLHIQLGRAWPGRIFYFDSAQALPLLAIYAVTVMTVGVPLKIWNSARIELKLEEQQRLLLQARMDALQSQINPHFLFNTLNSISSLVRFDPDAARELIVKLANILRRLLHKHDAFVQLREEIEFIDDYLDIEVVRFGRDKLRVVKDLDPASLEVVVPSMLLQPLVENSLKHGLGGRIDGGRITLRSRLQGDKLLIQVEDDGVGMEATRDASPATGIGMANVAERIKVLYGEQGTMSVVGCDGQGTSVTLELPLLQTDSPLELAGSR